MTDSNTVGPGTVLAGRYELTDIIGRGGFGTIWAARQINMDRDVAIKILPEHFMSVTDVVERFKREARLASRLRHPNTITLHDYGRHENLLYIVMERLHGEDLADVLKREGRLKPERIVHIARQVLKSLAEAHEEHIIHRDLKPENIFLSVVGDDRDHVKVLDFGIAKLTQPGAASAHDDSGRRLTMSGATVGTPTYMSPEQAAGEEVDGQTDLYALGIIMYESACGRPPFHHKDPVKVMRAQIFEPVPRMRDPSLHGTLLERVVLKALEKDRDDRFKSAHDMLRALAGEPVARPVIKGIPLGELEEPSTQELDLEEGTGPNTGDFESDEEKRRFPSTLSFAEAVDSSTDTGSTVDDGWEDLDAVPFGVVDGEERPPERETVRSGVTTEASLSAGAAPASDQSTTSSSILTVIESGEPSDEVILLTNKKDSASTPQSTSPSTPGARPDAGRDPRRERTPESDDSAPPGTEADERSSERSEISDSWQLGELELEEAGDVSVERQEQSTGVWALVAFLLIVVVVGLVFFEQLSALLPP